MLKPHRKPYGYKELLVYKKAEALQKETEDLTRQFPKTKTLIDLADQMVRSGRSGKQNVVEGWKRNTTKEYYGFLGFSLAAVAELEEDCDDIIRGVYPELMGTKGTMGEMGASQSLYTPFTLSEIEKIPFYPLDPGLPPIIQLKLRAKELGYLIVRLQKSLEAKMGEENTLAAKDKFKLQDRRREAEKNFEAELRREFNLPDLD